MLSSYRERLFWEKVEQSGDCWRWTAAITRNGYGYFNTMGEMPTCVAHRIAWVLLRSEIPDGLVIDHLCRNRWCVNPWHMDLVPPRVNTLRGESPAARAVRTNTCQRGHKFTEENTYQWRGKRKCRSCIRERNGYRVGRLRPAEITHCPAGHSYDEANTRIETDGSRKCRACDRERARRKRAALKEAARAA